MTRLAKDKDRLQMYVSLTKITIILCWLSLFAFWAIKIFGGNLFEIMVENENFIKFSDAVQNTWLKYIVSFLTISLSTYLAFGAVSQNYKYQGWQLFYLIFTTISSWAVANFINVEFLKMWYSYIAIVFFGIIFQRRWKKLLGFLPFILETIFSAISIMTRNISLSFIDNYLVLLIMLTDMYIMSFLYFLYANLIRIKKEI